LLLGLAASADGLLVGRCFGIAVLALGWSCWPGSAPLDGAAPLRAMFAYNVLIAAFLAYVGVAAYPIGVLLWPAAALHAAVALLLVWTSREGEGA